MLRQRIWSFSFYETQDSRLDRSAYSMNSPTSRFGLGAPIALPDAQPTIRTDDEAREKRRKGS